MQALFSTRYGSIWFHSTWLDLLLNKMLEDSPYDTSPAQHYMQDVYSFFMF